MILQYLFWQLKKDDNQSYISIQELIQNCTTFEISLRLSLEQMKDGLKSILSANAITPSPL